MCQMSNTIYFVLKKKLPHKTLLCISSKLDYLEHEEGESVEIDLLVFIKRQFFVFQ